MRRIRSKSGHADCLMIFPGALGDFLCFLPTAEAFRGRRGVAVTLVAKSAHKPLLAAGTFDFIDIDRREVSSLFASRLEPRSRQLLGGFDRVYSWSGADDPHLRANLAAISAGPVEVFRFDAFESGVHAVDRFAKCVGVVPGPLRVAVSEEARRWAAGERRRLDIDADTLVVHAGSGSARKNWQGMSELAGLWRRRRGRVVALVGPADAEVDFADGVVADQPIDRVAALLQIAPFFVGNDSGISHLAGALSCRGVVLFGNTDPSIWRPHGGDIRVVRARRVCATCDPHVFCTHRLTARDVLSQVDRYRSESYRRRS